jgi:hypothetical protein
MQRFLQLPISITATVAIAFAMTFVFASHTQAGLLSAIGKAAKIGKAGKTAGLIGGVGIAADTVKVLRRMTPDADVRRLALGFDEDGAARLADTTGGEWTVRNFGDLDDFAWQSAVLKESGHVPATHRRVELYVQDEQLFSHRAKLTALPDNLALRVVHRRKKTYPLNKTDSTLQVEARPHVLIETTTLRDLDEILFRLERDLNRASLRLLKIVPGTSDNLPSLPDRVVARAPEPQAVDPGRFGESLRALRGQTAVLTGRIENGQLLTQTRPGGNTTRLPLAEIRAAARDADVNLIVLDAVTPLQPGSRGVLGKRRSKTLDAAFQTRTGGDFIAALARHDAPISLRATNNGSRHVAIRTVKRSPDVEINARNASDRELLLHGIQFLTRTREFEEEHDSRVVWWLPSYVPVILFFNLMAGVLAWAVAYRQWWERIWPAPVSRSWLQRNAVTSARLFAFFVLFLPLFGSLALVWMVLRTALTILMIPINFVVWISSRIAMK